MQDKPYKASKPWDTLRALPAPPPLQEGDWRTKHGAAVQLSDTGKVSCCLTIAPDNYFAKEDLLQLAEFCTELAKQF